MEPAITIRICKSASIVVVIIHTKFQLYWMFETEIRCVGHFCPPLSMNRVTNYPSTNRVTIKFMMQNKNKHGFVCTLQQITICVKNWILLKMFEKGKIVNKLYNLLLCDL